MTNSQPDPMALPPEGYDSPASSAPNHRHPYTSAHEAQQPPQPQQQGYPAGPRTQPPYQGQPYPSAPQAQQPPQFRQPGHPTGPQQPYAAQPQYQAHAPAPHHHQSQPPMPNPAYGYPQAKSKVVAGLLGIFLGPLGIHRFYLGFTKIAVIQLILTLVLGAFGLGFVGLWGVIEGIMILVGTAHFRADARGVPLRD